MAYINDPEFIKAYFAVRPYLQSDLWAATSGQCAQPEGAGPDGPRVALTMDLDSGLDVVAGVDTFLPGVAKEFDLYQWQKHLKFIDLVGSTALVPVVQVAPPTAAGASETFTIGLPSCYPYEDPIVYNLGFGDGSKESTLKGPPAGAQATHTYAAEGSYSLSAAAVRDQHGRTFSGTPTVVPLVVSAASGRPLADGRLAAPPAASAARAATQPTIRSASGAPGARGPARATAPSRPAQAPSGATASAAQSSSGKKTKSGSGGGLSSLDPNAVRVTASEGGTTAIAIRGMTAPEEARVSAVDPAAGSVTLAAADGAALRFRLTDGAPPEDLAVGQRVWIDRAAGRLSVDGVAPCCGIAVVTDAEPQVQPRAARGRAR
jgi:hypothetical protein